MKKTGFGKPFSDDVKRAEADAHNGYCRIEDCLKKTHSFDHRLANTKENRKRFPLFIGSPFNCGGLCFKHHNEKSKESLPNYCITVAEAEVYEKWLEGLIDLKTKEYVEQRIQDTIPEVRTDKPTVQGTPR